MRTRLPALLPIFAVLAFCAPASGATYFVATGGDDLNDCRVDPCATIQEAIDQHRLAMEPTDVISIGPGTFVGNFEANDSLDDGLVIRGTLSGATRQTTLRGDGAGNIDGSTGTVGGCGTASATLRDVNVDTQGATDDVIAITLDRTSRLENVFAQNQTPTTATEVVFVCSGTPTISDSRIVATGTEDAVVTDGGLVMRDTVVQAENGVAVGQSGPFGDVVIQRSLLQASQASPNPIAPILGALTIDSSLLSGGAAGAVMGLGRTWAIRNSTIDAGAPGVSDPSTPALVLDALFGSGDVTLNSSIAVDGVEITGVDGGGLTCRNSDLPAPAPFSGWTLDCANGGTAGNMTTDPANLFVGGTPFDWHLRAGSPAIDAGDPGALLPTDSTTDLDGMPRVATGNAANCPTARRDMGAFERADVGCDTTAPAAPTLTGTNPGSPANNNAPAVQGSAEAGSTVRLYTSVDCGGNAAATGTAAALASPGLTVAVADNSTTSFRATATDAAGNTSPCSGGLTYVEATGTLPGSCANPLTGTTGPDHLDGTAFGDLIRGLEGDDLLLGLEGNDCLEGAAGNDRLWGNDGEDWLWGGDDDDQLKGRAGGDQLRGEAGDDRLTGADGADNLKGAAGDDRLSGGFGPDVLKSGGGADRIYGGRGENTYSGGRGDDRITSANGVDETVKCGPGDDTAIADKGDDLTGCETERVKR